MRRTLASRRDSRLGPSGEVYASNDRWIKSGRVTNSDIFPWLRSIQTQGFDLPIVGSSLEAVRVCIEAWHAGFKPVLVIMEDPGQSKETAEMRQLLRRLSRSHGGAGAFTYGPRIIVSEGPKCLVQLDHKGRAMDLIVCTNVGGVHTLAETWQLFKGPAIIVDDVATANEAEQEDRRKLLLGNIKQQRSAVVDPEFWEDRYDPERLSFWAVGYRGIAPNLLAGLAQMFVLIAVHRYSSSDYFVMWNTLANAVVHIPRADALTILLCSTLGLQLRSDRPTMLGNGFGLGYFCVGCWLNFYIASLSLVFLTVVVLLFCKYVKHIEITKPMLKWFCAVAVIDLSWYVTIALLEVYLLILSWNRITASVFLTVAFCGMEAQVIGLMLRAYDRFVWEPRRSQPDRVLGDQKLSLATCIVGVHCYTEGGRLVSMICGAVQAEDATFLNTNAVALFLGLVINVAGRSGWAGCLLHRFAGERLRPCVEAVLCPSAIQGLHNDAKFAMGWLRFFILAGLFIGRGCIHNKWHVTMTGREPGVWCWNGIVLVTALMAFMSEILEDWLVYVIVGHWPPPQWDCFGSAMVNRFDIPGRDDIYHPSHYIVPQSAFLAPSNDTTRLPSLKRATVKSRIHRTSTKLVQELAPTLSVSPNFKHARYFSAFQLQIFVGSSITMIVTGMKIGLGRQFETHGAVAVAAVPIGHGGDDCESAYLNPSD